MKKCTSCKLTKTFDNFVKNITRKDGFANECKKCNKARRLSSKDAIREKQKEWYQNNIEDQRQKALARWKLGGREKQYNLPAGSIDKMLVQQNFMCANNNCLSLLDWTSAMIDHDHKCCSRAGSCGKCVRGLLCNKCNWALGSARDSALVLEGLISYLKNFEEA